MLYCSRIFPVLNTNEVIQDQKLFMPANVVKQWRNHEIVGKEFQSFLDSFLESYEILEATVIDVEQEAGSDAKPNKRPADGPGGPSRKKPRNQIADSLVIDADSIDKSLLSECKVGSRDPIFLQVRASNHIYLVNKGSKDWQANESVIAGFGKGSFKLLKADEECPEFAVERSLAGSADLISFGGSVRTLGDILKELRGKNPDVKITYYKINFAADEPNQFTLQKTHRVAFVPRPEERSSEMKDHNAAAKEKLSLWQSSESLGVLWYMKLSAVKGLVPLKPALFLKGAVTLPPQKALVVVKP